jgi:hypothetical protein
MADRPDLGDAWRNAMAANMRYYEAWGRIVTEWLRDLAEVGRGLQGSPAGQASPGQPAGSAAMWHAPAAAEPAVSQPANQGAGPGAALVLEASVGEDAVGAFLVENQFGRPVETQLIADQVIEPGGAALPVLLQFDPAVVSLAPGERCVVRVRLTIPEAFVPGTDYRTVIRGPDLPGTSIPVVLRRAEQAASLAEPQPATVGGPKVTDH